MADFFLEYDRNLKATLDAEKGVAEYWIADIRNDLLLDRKVVHGVLLQPRSTKRKCDRAQPHAMTVHHPENELESANMKLKTLFALLFLSSLLLSPRASVHAAVEQDVAGGPSFPCPQAKSAIEQLICSDRELSALDLEYSRTYIESLRDKERREVDFESRNEAARVRERDSCVEGIVVTGELRPQVIACVSSWYDMRLAVLSDLSSMSASEWTPRLVGGSSSYSRDGNGAVRKSIQHDIYFKTPGTDRLFRLTEESGRPLWPARLDPSIQFNIDRKILGSLTLVEEYRSDSNPKFQYFFNKDGRLAAQSRRFTAKNGDQLYYQYDLVFFDAQGGVTQRTQLAQTDRKISPVRKDLSGQWGAKPVYATFDELFNAKFKSAAPLDVDKLGICYVELLDGYPTVPLILNTPSRSLEFFKGTFPLKNGTARVDDLFAPSPSQGTETLIGTVRSRKVYAITYGDCTGVLVERENNRFQPALYVCPDQPGNRGRVSLMRIDGEDVVSYIAPIYRGTLRFDLALDQGVPRRLDYSELLMAEQKRILPEAYSVGRLIGEDTATLTYRFSILKDDIYDGGELEIALGVRNGRAYVKSSRWDKPK